MPGAESAALLNTGTYVSPTWTEMTSVRDVNGGHPVWDFGDASDRRTRVKQFQKTQADMSTTLNVRADPAAADYVALFGAAHSKTALLDLMILNGDIATEGAIGIRAEFSVGLQQGNQQVDGVNYNSFDLKPQATANGNPSVVVMGAASAPTFTAL
jgi:hypothetical protein